MKSNTSTKSKSRKRKFIVALANHKDSRDDESVVVWAHTPQEAIEKAEFNHNRFSISRVWTAAELRNYR